RQGNPVLDVLVFVGDRAPSHVVHANQIRPKLPAAYKYDCVNSDVIVNRLTVENGKLKLPNGLTYNALSLQRHDIINLETLRGIYKLSQQGALIVGKKPKKLGGYNISKEMKAEFDALVKEIWSNTKTYSTGEWEQIFEENTIQKDAIVEGQPDFNFYHRRTENEDIYFVYNHNLTEKEVLNCSFLVEGKVPELWNAETGEITKLVEYITINGRTDIAIEMHPQESVFVVFKEPKTEQKKVTFKSANNISKPKFSLDGDNNLQAEVYANGNYTAKVNDAEDWTINVSDVPSQVEIKGNWEINFRAEDFHEATIKTDELFDWTTSKVEEIKHYSGTAIYTTTFNIEKEMLQADRQFQLNLGEVSVIAKVLVNGKDVGVSWIAPHALNVTKALKDGENSLEIQVTNQWTNRLIGDEKLPNQTDYDVRRSRKGFGSEDYRGKYKKMPDWYRNNQPLPEGPRKTFSVYSFQKATDDLLPSGLLGPVTISTSKIIKRK
ncbi:MAG: glycosyl hydrolase, partial [Polaribacter sp.]